MFVQLLSLFGQQVALFWAVVGGGSGYDGGGVGLLPINVGFLIQVLDFNYLKKNRGMNSHSIVHFNSKKSVGVLHFWLNLISILNAYFISWAKNGTMNIQFLYVCSFFGSSR